VDAITEDVIDYFIINLGDADSSDGDSDTDAEDVESYISDLIPL
jgi:hypothetical protein